MSDAWVVVVVVGAATVALKAAGPVFLGRRALPQRVRSVVDLLAPAVLTSLVVWQTVGSGEELQIDARMPGVAAAGIAVWRGVPLVGAMAIAATVTALVRLAA